MQPGPYEPTGRAPAAGRVILLGAVLLAGCLAVLPVRAREEAPGQSLESLKSYARFLVDEEDNARGKALERALALDPTAGYLHVEAAQRAYRRRDIAMAIAEANEALRLDPDLRDAHALLANIYVRLAHLGGEAQVDRVESSLEHLEALAGGPEERSLDEELWRTLAEMRELHARLVKGESRVSLERALEAWRKVGEGSGQRAAQVLIYLGRHDEAASLLRENLASDPDWTEGRMMLADALMETEDWAAAVAEFRLLVEADPADHRSRLQMGRALEEAGEFEEALLAYELVVEAPVSEEVARYAMYLRAALLERLRRFPDAEKGYRALAGRFLDSPETRLELVLFYQARGRSREARREMDALLASLGRAPDPWFRVTLQASDLLVQQGRIGEAVSLLERALESRPDHPDLSIALIETCQAQGDYRRAERLASRKRRQVKEPGTFWLKEGESVLLRQDVERGRAVFEAYLEAEGSSHVALSLVGSAFISAGLPDEAAGLYARAAAAAAEKGEDAEPFRLQRAVALAEAGRLREAEAALREILAGNPSSMMARAALVRYVFRPADDHEAALALAREVRERNPGVLVARDWEIEALIGLGRQEEALALVEEARAAAPDALEFLGLRVEVLAGLGRQAEALSEGLEYAAGPAGDLPSLLLLAERLRIGGGVEESIELMDSAGKPYEGNPLLDFSLGVAHERAGRLDRALEYLERAIETDPTFHSAMNYLGYTLAENGGDLKEARDLLERALTLNRNNAAYLDSLGWILVAMGKIQAAEPMLEKAARMVPDDPVVRMHLARLRENQSRSEEALEGYLGALRDGLNERVEEIRRRVRDLACEPPEVEAP